jgi:hypothetical protein
VQDVSVIVWERAAASGIRDGGIAAVATPLHHRRRQTVAGIHPEVGGRAGRAASSSHVGRRLLLNMSLLLQLLLLLQQHLLLPASLLVLQLKCTLVFLDGRGSLPRTVHLLHTRW